MRVVVVGASGRLGQSVLRAAIAGGHSVTAFVRERSKLEAVVGEETLQRCNVIQGDALDSTIAAALRGADAAVQAAGYLGASPNEEGRRLQELVQAVTRAAAAELVGARRLWVLGGAGVLDLPGRPGTTLLDVPGFPQHYQAHRRNLAFLQQPEFDSLDWSFACPGPMFLPDILPVQLPCWAAPLPTPLLLPVVAAIRGQLGAASYEAVAAAIVANLAPDGPLRHRRVGFAPA